MDRQGNKDGECKGIGNLMAILKTEIHISSIGEEIDLYGSAERIWFQIHVLYCNIEWHILTTFEIYIF